MDYEALDGALMVLVDEDDFGEIILITWFGKNELIQHDDTLQAGDVRNFNFDIADAKQARILAKEWLADIIVENERLQEDDGA